VCQSSYTTITFLIVSHYHIVGSPHSLLGPQSTHTSKTVDAWSLNDHSISSTPSPSKSHDIPSREVPLSPTYWWIHHVTRRSWLRSIPCIGRPCFEDRSDLEIYRWREIWRCPTRHGDPQSSPWVSILKWSFMTTGWGKGVPPF